VIQIVTGNFKAVQYRSVIAYPLKQKHATEWYIVRSSWNVFDISDM